MAVVTFPGRPLVSYPLLSFFYKVLYAGTIVVRLPFWTISYGLFPRSRPFPTWSFKQSLMVKIFYEYLHSASRAETPQPLSLEPGSEKERFEKIKPFSSDMYRGALESKTVGPVVIGGTWYPQRPDDPADVGLVMLHIHGGAMVLGDGRDVSTGPMAKLFHEHANVRTIFAPQYRLSSRPTEAPFPAAVQDSLTSYLYLVRTLGIPAENICVSGDSAGGNLVIALLRYLTEYGAQLDIPQPRSAVIIAPWVAPVKHLWPDITITSNPNFHTDYLGTELCRWGARTYARDVSPTDPYITPLGHPFATPVPMLVTLGGAEILAVDGADWAREMARVEGNELETFVEAGAPHDTLLTGHILGFEESSKEVARRIGIFIRQHA
jgi:acetyl esterase/lipase